MLCVLAVLSSVSTAAAPSMHPSMATMKAIHSQFAGKKLIISTLDSPT